MKKFVYLFALTGAIIYSCSTKTATSTATTSTIDTSSESVANGKTTFDAKCGKCHGLPDTGDHTAEQWKKIVAKMAPKAKLTPEETNWVLAYTVVNAKK